MAGDCNTPAWSENLDTTRLSSMIVFNSTGFKKSLLFFWFKLQTIGIHFPCLSWSITVFFTNDTQWHESPLFSFFILTSLSVHIPFPHLALLPDLLFDLLSFKLSTLNPDLLSSAELLNLILPVLCNFSKVYFWFWFRFCSPWMCYYVSSRYYWLRSLLLSFI